MKFNESIADFFESPKWGMNILLGSVASLIPLVGPIVLSGWLVSVFWARRESEAPARFPAFEFEHFAKYLERGLWPFLVNLAASAALVPVMLIPMVAVMFGVGAFAPHAHHGAMPVHEVRQVLGFAVIGAAIILNLVLMLAFYLVMLPLTLRATITQGFTQAFNFGFVRRFLALTWKESLAVWLMLFGMGIVMMIVTVVTCYIGLFPSVVIVSFAWHHLQKQLYRIYLSRGGEEVLLSAKLMETPPALPPVAS